ncbi:MAG: long-chain fatty acid--CoA ligase [Gallionella sp.]|nr:long-chain fatty acid--CoA ligase [Gallionella sp.]
MQAQQDDLITPQQAGTLHGLFVERARRSPDKIAYRHFERNDWRDITWREMLGEVARWQAALSGLVLQRGDRVAIMLRNCPYWVAFDQAAMSLGLVVVPLYTVDRPDNVAYIINDADVKALLFETDEQWQALRTVRDQLGGVKCFVSIDRLRDSAEPRLKCMDEFLPPTVQLQPPTANPLGHPHPTHPHPNLPPEGEGTIAPPLSRGRLGGGWVDSLPPEGEGTSDSLRGICSNDLASIIYTSGTTGKPKGVMLSHANMLINAYACLDFFPVNENDTFLSFLPLSHTFERTVGYYLSVMAGAKVAFARSVAQLSGDLHIIRPTILISVPRIYERVYGAVCTRLEEGSPLRRKLFKLTVEVGWARFLNQQGRGTWKASFLLWPLLQKLVAQKVLNHLGGRLRVALSGGAALSPEISRVFIGLGLPVIQGYGLTETSPVISGNHPENNFPDSVGQPIRDVQLKIGEQNALLVKGPNVMMGYWNNPEATKAIMDADGWLNTGDVVRISETGHIYITGRIKEIIVMSNGEKISPSDMEMAILNDPLFDQVMIIGEARPYLVALAVVNPVAWQNFARETGVRADMPEALIDSRVEGKVLKRIALDLRGFPGYAHVRRVLLMQEPWATENGLLTPTLKLKRDKVAERFAAQIKQLYERH